MVDDAHEAEVSDTDIARVLAHTPDATIVADETGRIVIVNPQAEQLFGYARDELEGQLVDTLVPMRQREAHRRHRARFAENPRPRPMWAGGELYAVRKDGSEFPVEISLSPMKRKGKLGVVAAIRDISERRRNEAALRLAEEQLRQVQKMEAIGNLAGGVAHDFNNLLSVILSYANLVLETVPGDDAARVDIEEIRRAAERAADLTRQLLAFSRKQMLEPKIISLGDVVLGIERMLRRLIGADIDLALVVPPSVHRTYADPRQIEQVVMNLAVNARDAMPEGGKLIIETADVFLDAEYAARHAEVVPGQYLMLAVSDSGIGMDESTSARVFEPFFTTKGQGKGTGLGLSTVYGIVQQSGGHIWVYSEPGSGTTFKVYLPVTDRLDARRAADDVVASPAPGSETILLVEDQEQVRTLVRSVLKRNGYQVLEADSAADALVISDQHPSKIDLLLTDVVMPQMSGKQLADRLADRRREMKVLYMSGYTDNSVIRRGVLEAGVAFLAKPLTPVSLLSKIRKVLDA